MNNSQKTRLIAALLLLLASQCVNAQTATSWATSKWVEIDFDDEYVRLGSNYASFSFATGFGTDIAFASPNPELHPISTSSVWAVSPTQASTADSVASAEAGWQITKNNLSGKAKLFNTVAGTASITPTAETPDLVAVSWATQSSSVDLGTPDSNGDIDWAPSATLGGGGGGITNSSGSYSITDPIVVWVEDTATGIAEPHTLFRFSAEADSNTELRWNDLAKVDEMSGEIMLFANQGPFLDATDGGNGSFSLKLGSQLVPDNQRGSLSFTFEDGVFTEVDATGAFQQLAPAVGTPAVMDSFLFGDGAVGGQFSLQIDTGPQRGVSDIAACSEGVHVQVGSAVDSVQTFAVQPSDRDPLEPDTTLPTGTDRVPRPCFGPISDDADLLFGNQPAADHELLLLPPTDAPTIDRFARLNLSLEESHKTLSLNRPNQNASALPSPNQTPAETRRWNAKVQVRDTTVDNSGVQIFAIGLVDIATHGETGESDFTLFSGGTDAITFSVGRVVGEGDQENVSVQLFIDGVQRGESLVPPGVISQVDWNNVEVSVEEQSGSSRFQLDIVGQETTTILDTTVDGIELSEAGYRLAVGSRTIDTAGGHDFDNLVLSYQQNGDVNWDTEIDAADVFATAQAVASNPLIADSVFDTNYDGVVDEADIQLVEDLVPNKLPGDANFDGVVDFPDFLALSDGFGLDTGLWSRGDFDRSGRVDFPDFLILSANFGATSAGQIASVPEPSSRFSLGVLFVALTVLHRVKGGQKPIRY